MLEAITNLINSSGFGVVLGAAISILTTLLATKSASKDKRQQRALDVTYDLKVRQLNLLIELQKAVQAYGRLTAQCQLSLLHDELYAENGNRLADPELEERRRLAGVEVNLLSSQIQSDAIRQKVHDSTGFDSLSNDPDVIKAFMFDSIAKIDDAIVAIGNEIRSIQGSLSSVFAK